MAPPLDLLLSLDYIRQGLSSSFTPKDLRRFMMSYHPDKTGSNPCTNVVYEIVTRAPNISVGNAPGQHYGYTSSASQHPFNLAKSPVDQVR